MDFRQIHVALAAKTAIIFILLTLIIPPSERDNHNEMTACLELFKSGTIVCVLDTGSDVYSSSGLRAGFNYELLKEYAAQSHRKIKITAAKKGENYTDSLRKGTVDILVRPDADTTTGPGTIKSRPLDGRCAWYMDEGRVHEMKDINLWISSFCGTEKYTELRTRFFSAYDPFTRLEKGLRFRRLSPYDDLLRKYARTIGWDWRMLAAVVYQESRFSINSSSFRGATGLMQIIPSTAAYYGIHDLLDPESNLTAGTRHLGRLQKDFPAGEFSPWERINFTLAAYNAGEGRIADCRTIADSSGFDSTRWEEIVKIIPGMREYTITKDGKTREGRFRGTETINYVSRIRSIYEAFCALSPDTRSSAPGQKAADSTTTN